MERFYVIREGTIVEGYLGKYLVAQVGPGKYLLISQEGNRWTDKLLTLNTLPAYVKKEGFRVVDQGGFK